jgi:hypothetical protein
MNAHASFLFFEGRTHAIAPRRRVVRLVLWFSAVLVAAVSNLDNLAAGFAYGVRDRRIGVVPNAVIAAVTMAGTGSTLIRMARSCFPKRWCSASRYR